MDAAMLRKRTQQYALRVVRLTRSLPSTIEGRVFSAQLLRSGTSVGANYRAACRARSRAEFISKIGIVIEEADESAFWIELIVAAGLVRKELAAPLLQETEEIVAIMVASQKSAKQRAR